MSFVVRPFERADRDQLTELINAHVAAVLPGVGLSAATVMTQVEPGTVEMAATPWVAERHCVVAERDGAITAAALVHRFGAGDDVREHRRGAAEIRWVVCRPDDVESGAQTIAWCVSIFAKWRVPAVFADGSLPAPGCSGVADTWPHIRQLLADAGLVPDRDEVVLVARCAALAALPGMDGATVRRSVGKQGARLELVRDDLPLGWIEVGEQQVDLARGTTALVWIDVGNLIVVDGGDRAVVTPALLSVAGEWLQLGGIERVVAYHAVDDEPTDELELLESSGFTRLVTNQRGWRLR